MFERYQENARRVIFFARYEASQFGSPHIDTEHLLLGILREDTELANQLLPARHSARDIRKQLEAKAPAGAKLSTSVDMPLSLAAQQVLTRAAELADGLGHSYIAPAHLLMGILKDEESVAAEVMKAHGVTLPKVQQALEAPRYPLPPQSSEVQAAVGQAHQQAAESGSAEVDPQHLLLAILQSDPALVPRVFDGIDPTPDIRAKLQTSTATRFDHPMMSLAANQVIAHAAEEAKRLGHHAIAPMHLLLGILDDEESLASEILKSRGVTAAKVRAAMEPPPAEPIQ